MVLQLIFLAMVYSSTIALVVSIMNMYLRSKPTKKLHHPPSPYRLPIFGHLHLIEPLIHRSFHKLSSKHGPLIRLYLGSVPCVVVSTPELAEEFLKTNDLIFSARKHSIAVKHLTYNSSFAFAPYGPYLKFIKKIFSSKLLSNSSILKFRPIRANDLTNFIKHLSSKAKNGESVDLGSEFLRFANNTISQMMLGNRCSGTTSEADEVRRLVREVTRLFGAVNYSDLIWFLHDIDLQGYGKRSIDTHKSYDAFLENIIQTHENVRKEHVGDQMNDGDLLDMLLDVAEDEKADEKLTRDNIRAIVLDFFTAATDTTASSMEWAMTELINNPRVMKKAQEEIDNVVGNNRLLSELDGPNLPYIRAIIKETIRLHPPIPMLSRKALQDCTIGGYDIPAETLLFVNTWAIARDEKYWESPLEFRPERFLQLNPIDVKGRHFELLPFGTGRKGCPGQALAMQELVTVIAALIQCFDWNVESGDGALDMTEQPGLTIPRAQRLVCTPVTRGHQINLP